MIFFFRFSLTGARHLCYIITTWIDKINKHVSKLYSIIKEFEDALDVDKNFYINDEIIESATDCHLRPNKSTKTKPKTCLCCSLISNLKKYETILFQMISKKNEKQSNEGNWLPCFEENLLRGKRVLKHRPFYTTNCHFDISNCHFYKKIILITF